MRFHLPGQNLCVKIAFLSFFLLLNICLNAQSPAARIHGVVKNSDKPIDAATVSLLKAADSSLVKIEVADKSGSFAFEKIGYGKYLIKTEAIGFDHSFTDPLEVTASRPVIKVKDIQLTLSSASLSSVTVTGKRPLIENKIDKTVVNVDASPTNTGLSALEVLERSPGVTVDNNGNISLKGKQGVVILVDDKPTYLRGSDLTNYLKNLSANQLDQIEIMTQPSAKYDAAGNSGIINIKTKKNRSTGLNGTITTSAIIAKYFKNTNSVNANWRKGKINLYGNAGYSYWEGFEELQLNRSSRLEKIMNFDRFVEQHTFGRYSGRPYNIKAGADWFAGKNTTLGIAINRNIDDDRFISYSRANIFNINHALVQYNDATSETHNPWTNVGFNINLEQKLDTSGRNLSAGADYILYRTKGNQYSYNYLYQADGSPSEDPYLLRGYLPADIDIISFKSDYKHPLKNNSVFEAGIKMSYVKTDNDARYTKFNTPAQEWDVDTGRSNHFVYKESINAAYVNIQKQIKKWGVQAGLRVEQTVADGNQISKVISFHKNYTKLFPTTYISYKLNESNTFGLSYGRRIERPGYQSLNPFQFQLDRYTYQQGNPNLQPQFSHNIELSYNHKGQLNISANYTSITDIINDVLISVKEPLDSNYTTYLTTQNIASSRNIGLSVNYNKQLKKWWTVNIFVNVYNNHYEGIIDEENINLNYTSFNSNFSSQFNFNKGWNAEISGFFNSKQLVSSAIFAYPMGMFSVGGGKKVLKDKGSIRINLRDPFYVMRFKGTTDLAKGITDINSHWDNRRYIITLSYRFGKTSDQQNRVRSSAADDEKNRVSTGGGRQ